MNSQCNHQHMDTQCNHQHVNTQCNHQNMNIECSHQHMNTQCIHQHMNTECNHQHMNSQCNHQHMNTQCNQSVCGNHRVFLFTVPVIRRKIGCVQTQRELTQPPGIGQTVRKTHTWIRVPGAARVFSLSQLSVQTLLRCPSVQTLLRCPSVQTLLRCPYSARVQSHASTSGRTLKIVSTEPYTIVWTHENTAHFDRNG